MHGKVGRQRKALAKRNPCGKVKHSRSEDSDLRRSPAFQRRVMDIVTEAVALVRNPDTGSQIGLALLRFDLTQTQAAAALNFAELTPKVVSARER